MGNKCHLYPVSILNISFNVRMRCGVMCRQVSSQKYNMPFNDSSSTSSSLNPPQYSMIKNTTRSLISFLCSYDFILNQSSSKSSSDACSSYIDKQKFFLLIPTVHSLFHLMNLSNHVPLVGVVRTTIFLSALSKVSNPSPRTPAIQILTYDAE